MRDEEVMGTEFFQRCSETAPVAPPLAVAWKIYQELRQSQWRSREEIERIQWQAVSPLLRHSAEQVPYYRDQWKSLGITADQIRSWDDFRRLPILTRSEYQQRSAEFVAESLPKGVMFTQTKTTSGTSGVPIEIRQTNVVHVWWLALFLRDLEWCGFDMRKSMASIRTSTLNNEQARQQYKAGLKVDFWHPLFRNFLEMGPCYAMDLIQDPRRQLEWLRKIQPTYLLTYPSTLDFFSTLIADDGIRIPSLEGIQTFAETFSADQQARIETAFQVPVHNLYSCSEAGYLASACPSRHGLHVHAENVLIEVLDDNGLPCAPGQTGRVVMTPLRSHSTPMIRYEIQDQATVGASPCPCGRGLPLLRRVEGKRRPLLWLDATGRKSSTGLVEATRKLGVHRQIQFVQKSLKDVEIRLVPSARWNAEMPAAIQRVVDEFFEHPMQVDLKVVDWIERPPGGKLLEVVNELDRKPHGR